MFKTKKKARLNVLLYRQHIKEFYRVMFGIHTLHSRRCWLWIYFSQSKCVKRKVARAEIEGWWKVWKYILQNKWWWFVLCVTTPGTRFLNFQHLLGDYCIVIFSLYMLDIATVCCILVYAIYEWIYIRTRLASQLVGV